MKRQRTKNEPIYRQVRKNYQSKDGRNRTYVYWIVDYVESGKRKKKQCKTEEEAKDFAEKFTEARDRIGKRFFDMSHAEIEDAIQALGIRKQSGRGDLSLVDAMQIAIDSTSPPPAGGLTVSEAVDAYLEEARRDGLRSMSITDLTNKLGRFAEAYRKRPIAEIDRAQADAWLRGLCRPDGGDLAPVTKKNYRTVVVGQFTFAIDQGYATDNPLASRRCRRREKMVGGSGSPAVYSVEEAKSILRAAEKHAPSLVPMLSLGFFGGVRVEEAKRMSWEKYIDLDQQIVFITGDVAKKRSTDNFGMTDTLCQWLMSCENRVGAIAPQPNTTYESQRRIVKRESKVTWVPNGARHRFASYHFQLYNSRDFTMKILRHKQGSEVFDSHYKNPSVTRKESERYFCMLPKTLDAAQVIPFDSIQA